MKKEFVLLVGLMISKEKLLIGKKEKKHEDDIAALEKNIAYYESEFNKFTKAKQNKLLLEWENTALKEFIKDLFYNEEIMSKPTDFVSCNFQNIEQY